MAGLADEEYSGKDAEEESFVPVEGLYVSEEDCFVVLVN